MAELSWFGYVEPVATAIAAIVAIYAALASRRSAAAQRRDAILQNEETQHQGAIALEAMLLEHHKTVLAWADECINWMSQSYSFVFCAQERAGEENFFRQQAECVWHLSALIDRGRLLFPNEESDEYGVHKARAFRGFRPVVLDQLKTVHDRIRDLHSTRHDTQSKDTLSAIRACRKAFVSEVQSAVDPQARQARLECIVSAPTASAALEIAARS